MLATRMLCVALAAGFLSIVSAVAGEPAKFLFALQAQPTSGQAEPYGSYAKGCLAGAVALPETGPGWQAMRLSRNRNWGHPETVAFIERLSQQAARLGWPRLYVGDVSQPRGGPMNGGHRSHQIGLDVDIWLRIPAPAALTKAERETISSDSVVRPDRLAVNDAWRPEHRALIRIAAEDRAVARIFVNAAIKKALCESEPENSRDWLRKVRPWWGHDSHFHARLNCPANARDCIPQELPPPGDGCDADLAWWFTDEALNPKPPDKPPVDLTLEDLPLTCRDLVRQ